MIQIIYNNQHSYNNFGLIAKTVKRPLLPTKRRSDVVIPGRDGSYDFSDDTYENIVIPVVIQCIADSFENLRSRARNIAAWLGQTDYKPLIFTDEPDKYYSAKIYDAASVEKIVNLAPGESATINFECFPFAFSMVADSWLARLIEPQIIQNGGTRKVSPIITITPVAISGGMDEAVEVTGAFNSEDPFGRGTPGPIVTTLTNPAITIGGKRLVYTGTLIGTEKIIINTDTLQATKSGVNILSAISGEWPILEVGNNEISITDDTSECGSIVELSFRKRWL